MNNDGVGPAGVEVTGKVFVRGRVTLQVRRIARSDLEFAPELIAHGSGFDEGHDVVFVTKIQVAVGIHHAGGAKPFAAQLPL